MKRPGLLVLAVIALLMSGCEGCSSDSSGVVDDGDTHESELEDIAVDDNHDEDKDLEACTEIESSDGRQFALTPEICCTVESPALSPDATMTCTDGTQILVDQDCEYFAGTRQILTQDGLLELAANRCTEIGSLRIAGEVHSLLGLETIERVNGNLRLEGRFESTDGLNSLREVGGSFVTDGPHIRSLTGLENLERVDEEFWLGSVVESVEPLRALRHVGMFGIIGTNLQDLEGLRIETIGNSPEPGSGEAGSLVIRHTSKLKNISALRSLNANHRLFVVDIIANEQLESLNGLQSLSRIESLTVAENPMLGTLRGLGQSDWVTDIYIRDNASLSTLAHLGASRVSRAEILWNHALKDVGFPNARDGTFLFSENNALVEANGFWNEGSALRLIQLQRNPNLQVIRGIMGSGNLTVSGSPLLRTVSLPDADNLGIGISDAPLLEQPGPLGGPDSQISLSLTNVPLTELDLSGGKFERVALLDTPQLTRVSVDNLADDFSLDVTNAPVLDEFTAGNTPPAWDRLNLYNTGFTDLGFLAGVETISNFTVRENLVLTSLCGTEDLRAIQDRFFRVQNNPKLPRCAIDALLAQLESAPETVEIDGNDTMATCE